MRLTLKIPAALILGAVLCGFAGGCASTESDMPWNQPQSWEGSPALPGFGPEGTMGGGY